MESAESVHQIDPHGMSHAYVPEITRISRVASYTRKEKLFELEFMDGRDLGHDPGQFVEISIFGIGEAPISVSSSPGKKGSFEICVRAVGDLTNALHRMSVGDNVGVRGPFGKGFDISEMKGKDLLFIGGGIGIVPLRSLINYAIENSDEFGKLSVLYGAKSPEDLLFPDDEKLWAEKTDFRVTVDHGSPVWKGNVGVITTLIPPMEFDLKNTIAVVVGPPVMYKFVIMALRAKGFGDDQIIVSLERRMKCGLGKCGHCQMNHVYVCQDGPVFKYSAIRDLEEAIK